MKNTDMITIMTIHQSIRNKLLKQEDINTTMVIVTIIVVTIKNSNLVRSVSWKVMKDFKKNYWLETKHLENWVSSLVYVLFL